MTPRPGADVSFVGVARPFGRLQEPSGFTPVERWPIFERPFGHKFWIVIEGKPGPSRRTVGRSAFSYSPFNPAVRPDLQVIVSRPLGDGSRAVCDDRLPDLGGVPVSASFDETQAISNAMNDFACRFVNGDREPLGRINSEQSCFESEDSVPRFANPASRIQFCALLAPGFEFPVGDTTVTVRLRDSAGDTGPPASLIIHVLDDAGSLSLPAQDE